MCSGHELHSSLASATLRLHKGVLYIVWLLVCSPVLACAQYRTNAAAAAAPASSIRQQLGLAVNAVSHPVDAGLAVALVREHPAV
jgi:hypothetical protein